MSAIRPLLLIPVLLLALPVHAQNNRPLPSPAQSQPLSDDRGVVREQPLSSGRVTGSVDIAVPLGQTPVTVRSITPTSVVGQYQIDFSALDVDGDGFISVEEAQANPALADEFRSLDRQHRGKLDRQDLAGWLAD